MHNLQIAHPEVAAVEYHVWWPGGNDPFWLYNQSDVQGRASFYNVTGVPYMKVDGKYPVNQNTLATMYNSRYNDPAPVQMEIAGDYNSGTREGSVTVTMTCVEAVAADNYMCRIALTETDIYYNTAYNDNHYNVMRDMFPTHQGSSVTLDLGVPEQLTFDFTLPTGVPPNAGIVEANARIVAFIQPATVGQPNNGEAQQAVWEWVMNLTSTGVEDLPARHFALEANYPNPFNPSTVIPVKVERAGSAVLEIVTADGRRVTTLHEGALASGDHEFRWDGTDAEGSPVASGVYLARLIGQTETHSRRLVLLK